MPVSPADRIVTHFDGTVSQLAYLWHWGLAASLSNVLVSRYDVIWLREHVDVCVLRL